MGIVDHGHPLLGAYVAVRLLSFYISAASAVTRPDTRSTVSIKRPLPGDHGLGEPRSRCKMLSSHHWVRERKRNSILKSVRNKLIVVYSVHIINL